MILECCMSGEGLDLIIDVITLHGLIYLICVLKTSFWTALNVFLKILQKDYFLSTNVVTVISFFPNVSVMKALILFFYR